MVAHFGGEVFVEAVIGCTGGNAALLEGLGDLSLDALKGVRSHRAFGTSQGGITVACHGHDHPRQAAIQSTTGEGRAAGGLHMAVKGLVPIGEQLEMGAIPWAVWIKQNQHQTGFVLLRVFAQLAADATGGLDVFSGGLGLVEHHHQAKP